MVMGQQEILDFLEKNNGVKYNSVKIASEIGITKSSTVRCLKCLRKSKPNNFNFERAKTKVAESLLRRLLK